MNFEPLSGNGTFLLLVNSVRYLRRKNVVLQMKAFSALFSGGRM